MGVASCSAGDTPRDKQSIDLRPLLQLRESGDSVVFADDIGVIAGAQGEYIVLGAKGRGAIAFYDAAGQLTHLTGAKGRGPGEFWNVSSAAVGPGDSLFVSDMENGRLSILSPGDHRFVRSVPAGGHEVSFRGTPQGRLLGPMIAWDRDRKQTRYSLRRAPWDGSPTVAIASSVPMERFAATAVDSAGRVWVADRRTYTVTLFDRDRVVRTVQRHADWFPADTSPITQPAWMGKGRPFITDMRVGQDGTLWVLIKRKNPRYGDTTAPKTKYISPMGLPPLAEIFEGVLEALDPVSGALLDSRVVPGDMIGFIAPGRLSQKTDADSSGALMLQIWEVRLKPPS